MKHIIPIVVVCAFVSAVVVLPAAFCIVGTLAAASAAGDNDRAERQRAACRFYQFAQSAGLNAVIMIDGKPVQCEKTTQEK